MRAPPWSQTTWSKQQFCLATPWSMQPLGDFRPWEPSGWYKLVPNWQQLRWVKDTDFTIFQQFKQNIHEYTSSCGCHSHLGLSPSRPQAPSLSGYAEMLNLKNEKLHDARGEIQEDLVNTIKDRIGQVSLETTGNPKNTVRIPSFDGNAMGIHVLNVNNLITFNRYFLPWFLDVSGI